LVEWKAPRAARHARVTAGLVGWGKGVEKVAFFSGGDRGRETGRKGGRRCAEGGRRGGGKRDSQGGGKREKKGRITQHCAILRNRKNAKGREPKNTGREPGLKGTGSRRFKPPCPPLF